jgi:hypothetical protein
LDEIGELRRGSPWGNEVFPTSGSDEIEDRGVGGTLELGDEERVE